MNTERGELEFLANYDFDKLFNNKESIIPIDIDLATKKEKLKRLNHIRQNGRKWLMI